MLVKVTGIQMGPFLRDYKSNLEKAVELLEKAVKENSPDVVVFSGDDDHPVFLSSDR